MADSFLQVLARRTVAETPESDREKVFRELHALIETLTRDAEVRRWLRSAESMTQTAVLNKEIFKKLHPTVFLVVQALVEAKRLPEIKKWWKEYLRVLEHAHAGKEVRLTTVRPLPDKMRLALQKALEKRFEMPVFLTELLDPSLRGGMTLTTEDWSLDASLKGRLTRLTQELIDS